MTVASPTVAEKRMDGECPADLVDRILVGEKLGKEVPVPDWVMGALADYRVQVLDPKYPCYFGTVAERQGDIFYSYVDGGDLSHLPATLRTFSALAAEADRDRRTTLAVFVEPRDYPHHQAAAEHFWEILQYIVNHDTEKWPEGQPLDPEDPMWAFSCGGESFFAFAASPTYSKRKSRNIGSGLALFFQPKHVFQGIEGHTKAGALARKKIRARLKSWDGIEPHPELKDYGDSECREWKQAFLPDDERPVSGECPLKMHAVAKRS